MSPQSSITQDAKGSKRNQFLQIKSHSLTSHHAGDAFLMRVIPPLLTKGSSTKSFCSWGKKKKSCLSALNKHKVDFKDFWPLT